MPDSTTMYNVRDVQGNVYGPAPLDQIRQWFTQGRLAPTMFIAPENSNSWEPITQSPLTADLFGGPMLSSAGAFTRPGGMGVPESAGYGGSPTPPGAYGGSRQNAFALAGMICGIASVVGFCSPLGALVTGIAAIVLGVKAKGQMRVDGSAGRGRATAAIVLGIIGLLLGLVWGVGVLAASSHFAQINGAWHPG